VHVVARFSPCLQALPYKLFVEYIEQDPALQPEKARGPAVLAVCTLSVLPTKLHSIDLLHGPYPSMLCNSDPDCARGTICTLRARDFLGNLLLDALPAAVRHLS
jgi:hypothetical protein